MQFIELTDNEINTAELFHVRDNGPLLVIDREALVPTDFQGKYIEWNDSTYSITGVEWSLGIDYGDRIGIKLKPLDLNHYEGN